MNNQSKSIDVPMRSICRRPELRGNLFLGLLLGMHLLISLPKSPNCAYAQIEDVNKVASQHNNGC